MSSGNPFRRALKQDEFTPLGDVDATPSASSQLTAQFQQPGLVIQSSIRGSSPLGKTKKHVRIRSPEPTSPISPHYFSEHRPILLPPPPPHSPPPQQDITPDSAEDTPTDPFASSAAGEDLSSGDDEVVQNTMQNAHIGEHASGSSGLPFNPFQKTLATMEPDASPVAAAEKDKIARIDGTMGKASMDVDSFTKMLMTGKAGQGKQSQPLNSLVKIHNHGPAVDSNSSTDTSSLSRQSLFDTLQGPQLESPRTSYELSVSDDDEETSLMGEGRKVEKEKEKKKPLPPKPRHGKLVTPRAPQTVSFSDFTSSAPAQSIPSSTLQRSPTDLNKPLPSLPESSSPEPSDSSIVGEKTPTMPATDPMVPEVEQPALPPPQKKTPPAVPLARRQSQLRTTTQSRHRSNSAQESSHQANVTENQTQTQKMPPPPPPTRRHAASLSNSTNPSTTDLPSTTDGSHSPAGRIPSGGSLAQALSGAQNLAGSRHSSSTSLTTPPPPPPPRRRASSGRGSLDMPRPSSLELARGSFDSGRRSSAASSLTSPRKESGSYKFSEGDLAEEPEDMNKSDGAIKAAAAPQANILADMEAFQREIDALRQASEGPGSSR
ncbi:hypothetical protein NA57DRAFT_75471 [Rhizodiscina lignyota]|uniref:Uncharacterized protein n=1 Tax=Rhizodiscina lignyota TaxID=1504668 RepID=A0A9P4MBR1_9PEZI|nr:hypothetical protein NA57DRAFT_75471 [Rhizodiscina lignyota]